MMKKFLCITLSLVLPLIVVLPLAGCDKKLSTNENTGKKFSVGLVSDTAGINDESFNASAWDGMTKVKKDMDFDIKYLESAQEADYESNLEKITDGTDAVFAVGYRMAPALKNVASKNPDTIYIMLDHRYEDTLPNTFSIEFRDHESSFEAGYIAAYMTKTNKVGIILGAEGVVIDRFRYGFESGVIYAAKELRKNIEVDVQCANNFQDDVKGKAMANSMYTKGIDIIFHAAGNLGKGVIEAAKENNKYVIGVDQDQHHLAPNNVLTSVMKLVGGAVYDICEDLKDGKKLGGESRSVGLKEGGVGLASTTGHLVPKDIIAKVENIKQKIIDEEIKPAHNKESFDQFTK